MRYFSTFTGIGGFELGIERAFSVWDRHTSERDGKPGSFKQSMEPTKKSFQPDGNKPDNIGARDSRKVSCVGYSEIDKYAIKTYEEHYEYRNYGDITKINPAEIPDFDLIVGGFPCQAFSIAGKRKGFEDARGTLFFDVARILSEKRPRHLVLENVKGLLGHDGGKTWQTILTVLTDLGYRIEWQVLNSKDFGVPQNRERTYIIGHLRGECGRQIFPLIGKNESVAQDFVTIDRGKIKSRTTSTTVDASYHKGLDNHQQRTGVMVGTLRTFGDGNGFRAMKSNVSPTIPSRARNDGSGQPVVAIREATRQGYAEAYEGDSINYSQPNSNTRRGRVGKGVANTLETSLTQGTLVGSRIRRLTPIECERLQGFPDNWTVGSDTQRYKQCGNAVTVNVVAAVMTALGDCLYD